MKQEANMTFFEHLGELRDRLIKSVIAIFIGFSVCSFFAKGIFRIMRVPFDKAYYNVFSTTPTLQGITMLESFVVYLKVALLAGIFVVCPFLFYQVWRFIEPALKESEKKHVIPFVALASLCFIGGALFGYFFVFPKSFEFLLGFSKGEFIAQNIRMQDYFSFASMMLMGFGAAFIAPLIVLYLVFFRILDSEDLIQWWRPICIGILIASALLTPADIASMMLMFLPLATMYGITIVVAKFLPQANE